MTVRRSVAATIITSECDGPSFCELAYLRANYCTRMCKPARMSLLGHAGEKRLRNSSCEYSLPETPPVFETHYALSLKRIHSMTDQLRLITAPHSVLFQPKCYTTLFDSEITKSNKY